MKKDQHAPLEFSEKDDNQRTKTSSEKTRSFKPLLLFLTIVFAFSLVGLGGYILGLNASVHQKNQTTASQTDNFTTPATGFTNNSTQKKRRVLMQKDIEGGQIIAYRLSDDLSEDLNAGVFAIRLEAGKYHPVIFSISSPSYGEDKLFEVVDNELLVVNGQINKIDIYTYQVGRVVEDVQYLSSLDYKESIKLPPYQIGAVYGIVCDQGVCEVFSAHHQESGCRMNLDIKTKEFSNITCSDHGGEFSPEPL